VTRPAVGRQSAGVCFDAALYPRSNLGPVAGALLDRINELTGRSAEFFGGPYELDMSHLELGVDRPRLLGRDLHLSYVHRDQGSVRQHSGTSGKGLRKLPLHSPGSRLRPNALADQFPCFYEEPGIGAANGISPFRRGATDRAFIAKQIDPTRQLAAAVYAREFDSCS
jgi:hypothetical protein